MKEMFQIASAGIFHVVHLFFVVAEFIVLFLCIKLYQCVTFLD